ncbi:hypothetical protein [Bradyrhizobium sp. CCBAU 51753]|nr:hypothetical protein [Bradyrhizobium sp. CCBAU 51753]
MALPRFMLLLAALEDGINLACASGNAEQSLKQGARREGAFDA